MMKFLALIQVNILAEQYNNGDKGATPTDFYLKDLLL